MATLVIGAGQQVVNLGGSGPFYDVYDAETNDSVFLTDYLDYVANNRPQSHISAYPIRFFGADPFVWNGGTILGNIPAARDHFDWYNAGNDNFNSAGMFIRGGIDGTINRLVIGERDNLNSYPADGIRTVQAGRTVINGLTAWGCRDDLLEADSTTQPVTFNDLYAENLFVGFSATGAVSSKNITVNRGLMHFRRWLYRGSMQYGLPFKTDGESASPNFLMTDVVLAVGPSTFGDGGTRLPGGIANCVCRGDCRVLVMGGFMQSPAIRSAYQSAGFTVIEDGNGSAATNEYLARKAEWLGETGSGGGGGNPDPVPPAFDGNVRTRIICSAGFFTPAQDAGLLSWFASDDANTVTRTGGAVSAWRSKRGSPIRELVQSAAASRPSTGTRSNNRRNVLDSDAGDFLAGTVAIPADGNYAVHFAALIDAVTNQYQAPIAMNSAWQLEAGNGVQFNGFLRCSGADNLALAGGPFSGLVIGSLVFDKAGNKISVVINGVERASGPYTETHAVSQSLKVLCNRGQNQFLDGAITDVIITTDLTKTTQYQAYLSAKHTVV